jgi:hypothetical protein
VELHDAAGGGSKKYQIPQGLKKLLEEISGQVFTISLSFYSTKADRNCLVYWMDLFVIIGLEKAA